ncbi:D-alanine--D-alanine ligase family protein [Terrabacter terrigena]|uniref:D-alanine--D-alanine ligase n=1 Tax=Terrabacter terrigena TaxID=574718 RepID=A0ABW3MRG2_9MICO
MRVAVIHGGTSSEHDVSVASGEGIADGLRRAGHDVVPVLVDRAGEWHTPYGAGRLVAVDTLLGCDVAVPALHGVLGEDGTVQGFLDVLGVRYVGSPVAASAVCLDKQLTKLVVAGAGVPVAPGVLVPVDRARAATCSAVELDRVAADLAAAGLVGPVFVKPVHGGSSIGVTRIATTGPPDLARALGAALEAGSDSVLVEAEVCGLEVDVPVLELPDGEVRCGPSLLVQSDPDEPFFTEAAKYASGATRFAVPAPLGTELTEHLERLAATAYRALGCRGLARVDFLVGSEGPVLNEVNTFPGFTPASQFPRMWAAAGIGYPALVDLLVRTASTASVGAVAARP